MSSALSGFLSHCATIFPGKTLKWFNEITEMIFMDMIFIESLYKLFLEEDYKVSCMVYWSVAVWVWNKSINFFHF